MDALAVPPLLKRPAAIFLVDWLGYLGACLAQPMAWIGGLLPLAVAFVVTARKISKT